MIATALPRAPGLDNSLALLREGYCFVSRRCEQLHTDAFRTRLMLRDVVCMRGRAAAELFYGEDRFTRVGAMPLTALKLLQDRGSVQALDGAAHRHRKRMFMAMMPPDSIARLVALFEQEWQRREADWRRQRQIILLDEMRALLMQAACAWTGLAVSPPEIGRHTREVTEMIAAAGSIGPRNWRAQLLRLRSERWVRALVRRTRAGVLQVPSGSPADLIASYRDQDGRLLDVTSAGVELLNLIRPLVAIAYFIVFAAVALHRHPEHGAKIRAGDQRFLDAFVLEVRRHAPFFPLIGGRAKAAFDHWGHHFAAGDWVVLDLYGTDHDARVWPDPAAFRPQRFLERAPDPFDMVPQGGGNYETTHRCPGEWATEAVLKAAAHRLAGMSYDVPPQDLAVDLSRMPALPRSGFIIRM